MVMWWLKVHAHWLKITVGSWSPGQRRQSHFRTLNFKTSGNFWTGIRGKCRNADKAKYSKKNFLKLIVKAQEFWPLMKLQQWIGEDQVDRGLVTLHAGRVGGTGRHHHYYQSHTIPVHCNWNTMIHNDTLYTDTQNKLLPITPHTSTEQLKIHILCAPTILIHY